MAMLNNQRVDQIHLKKNMNFPENSQRAILPWSPCPARRWTHGNYRFAGLHQCAWAIYQWGDFNCHVWFPDCILIYSNRKIDVKSWKPVSLRQLYVNKTTHTYIYIYIYNIIQYIYICKYNIYTVALWVRWITSPAPWYFWYPVLWSKICGFIPY